ncbi:hypothetical protein [Oceanobacillus manasiensis]|uniref:hypothetical protein n=1 Tax=Oceanobacillus manasiensis TaxID=586413 RepID=UPI0005A9A1DA|nr:hypothetical protein [Oceanobacillus manasiensis]
MHTDSEKRDGKVILLTITWIATFLPYLFSPIAFGPFAFFLGLVLKRGYDVGKQSKIIMVLAVVNTIGGMIFANWVLRNYGGL